MLMLRKYLPADVDVTLSDLFCGAGGSSTGLVKAGMRLVLAANHWQVAVDTHAANHRDADHWCEDINKVDMRRLPRTRVLWVSPICTEASPAGGRTGRRRPEAAGQLALIEEGHVPQAGFERTRATFHDVIRATEVRRYDVVLVENVPEVAFRWELFDWWLQGMVLLGYRVQIVSVDAAHVHGTGGLPAPQWRGRLYLAFTREGIRQPDLAPQPLAFCRACGEDVQAEQWWKPTPRGSQTGRRFGPDQVRIGKYREQYLYRCQRCATLVEPYVLPAAAALDWSNLGERVCDRVRRPLVPNTRARIAAGLRMVRDNPHAFMVNTNHDDVRVYRPGDRPLPTRTAKIGDGLVVPPSFITMLRNHGTATSIGSPLATIAAGGNHHGLTTLPPALYSARDHHALVVPYYRTGVPKSTSVPMDTITTRDRFSLVNIAGVLGGRSDADLDELVDGCLYRMVQPPEHLAGQAFPADYIVHGGKGERTAQAGNAVAVNVSHWIGDRVMEALAV